MQNKIYKKYFHNTLNFLVLGYMKYLKQVTLLPG